MSSLQTNQMQSSLSCGLGNWSLSRGFVGKDSSISRRPSWLHVSTEFLHVDYYGRPERRRL